MRQFPGGLPAEDAPGDHGPCHITTTLDLYGHLYPGEMDRYADRLDEAATEGDAAKMRPDEDTDEADPEESGC